MGWAVTCRVVTYRAGMGAGNVAPGGAGRNPARGLPL